MTPLSAGRFNNPAQEDGEAIERQRCEDHRLAQHEAQPRDEPGKNGHAVQITRAGYVADDEEARDGRSRPYAHGPIDVDRTRLAGPARHGVLGPGAWATRADGPQTDEFWPAD